MVKTAKGITGALGEDLACKFLERKGFKLIERNFRRPWGEIDIIAEKAGEVRFVEVKTVSSSSEMFSRESFRPEENIHEEKLKKVVRTAQLYMEEKDDKREYQIDAVGIILDPVNRTARCRHFEQILE